MVLLTLVYIHPIISGFPFLHILTGICGFLLGGKGLLDNSHPTGVNSTSLSFFLIFLHIFILFTIMCISVFLACL